MASEILRSKAQTDSERNMLATMEACARRGAHIIRQVLTFARGIEGKRIALQPRHLLSEIAEIAGETFPKNIELETDVAKDLWPVIGDVTQLHQVVMNLCVNARDAMKEGGRLGISAENADLDETFALMTPGAKSGPYVHLSISDTGTGIPPEHFDKIFDPFYTTKAPGKGTGLGLSTVLGIVKSHGGFIQFKSQLGKGTCFEVYLPATPDAKPVARPSCAPTPRGNGELILVVDDEISIRTVATKILEVSGYKVVSAAEGTEALAVFMQNRAAIAAVVTDMLMPGMDGPDLIRVLRRIDPQIRIIGISGMGDSTPAGGVESLAMSALLTKPFTGASLLFALHAVLQAPPGAKVDASTSPWRGVSAAPWGPASGSAGNSRRQSPTGEIAGQRPAPPGGTAVSPDPASGDGTPATDQTHL
jgi:CheY-like chemotaxis protein